MARARYVVPNLHAAQKIAKPALDRGYCTSRDEYKACRSLAKTMNRGLGAWRDQLARSAYNAMPKEGPGALSYYREVIYPNIVRRQARFVRINGGPFGSGNRFD